MISCDIFCVLLAIQRKLEYGRGGAAPSDSAHWEDTDASRAQILLKDEVTLEQLLHERNGPIV